MALPHVVLVPVQRRAGQGLAQYGVGDRGEERALRAGFRHLRRAVHPAGTQTRQTVGPGQTGDRDHPALAHGRGARQIDRVLLVDEQIGVPLRHQRNQRPQFLLLDPEAGGATGRAQRDQPQVLTGRRSHGGDVHGHIRSVRQDRHAHAEPGRKAHQRLPSGDERDHLGAGPQQRGEQRNNASCTPYVTVTDSGRPKTSASTVRRVERGDRARHVSNMSLRSVITE
ncbi:hypothetical protein OG728_37895 [Streptomyces microflavus]|nr:hypothetical protein [Streptomyces sp. MBT57]WSR88955.1 hypothetical protein OG728_00150 [Streptomyces microflavus]WSR95828.1 hypothetical protein OG728_37895 [Streptomyces microflavus]